MFLTDAAGHQRGESVRLRPQRALCGCRAPQRTTFGIYPGGYTLSIVQLLQYSPKRDDLP